MKRMLSGIKPSGVSVTLGNYLGGIKPFVEYQNEYEMFVFLADLHALTVFIKPEDLRKNTENLVLTYLAAGLDPEKTTIFKQSDLCEPNQLEWILTCNTDLPDLTKMPQYKNYQERYKGTALPAGILCYPNLMSADCLLYDADKIPVGEDQLPHLYLMELQARNFNKRYGKTFKIPQPVVSKVGAKIMSLRDPSKKMSKSESDLGTIYMLEDVNTARKKIMQALTDSEKVVKYDPKNKPGISNLMTIYSCLTGLSFDEIEDKFKDIPHYGVFKRDLADVVCNEMIKIQQKVDEMRKQGVVEKVLSEGKEKASVIAKAKIDEVYSKVGLR